MEATKLKRVSKDEFAKALGIGRTALKLMLNVEFYEELVKAGYKKTQKYLTQAQIDVLTELNINRIKEKY